MSRSRITLLAVVVLGLTLPYYLLTHVVDLDLGLPDVDAGLDYLRQNYRDYLGKEYPTEVDDSTTALADDIDDPNHSHQPVQEIVDPQSGAVLGTEPAAGEVVDPEVLRLTKHPKDSCPVTRFKPKFWTIRATTSKTFTIYPDKKYDLTVRRQCLSNAIFTASVVSAPDAPGLFDETPDWEDMNVDPDWASFDIQGGGNDVPSLILPVAPPEPIPNHSGYYTVTIDRGLLSKIPEMYRGLPLEIRVRLAFGDLKEVRKGNVCGPYDRCDALEFASTKPSKLKFSGDLLQIDLKSLPVGWPKADLNNQDEPAPCYEALDFSAGSGLWLDSHWVPLINTGDGSRLCALDAPPTFHGPLDPDRLPESSPYVSVRWLAFYGDSNMRHMFGVMAGLQAGVPMEEQTESFVAYDERVGDRGERQGRKVSTAVIQHLGGTGSSDDDPIQLIVYTWRWWFMGVNEADWEHASGRLAEWTSLDLVSALRALQVDQVLSHAHVRGFRIDKMNIQAERIYTSLGSHSDTQTAYGTKKSLNFLRTALEHTSPTMLADRTRSPFRIFTTTGVLSSAIPTEKYPHQDLIRNNAVIRARNDVVKKAPAFSDLVIDVGEMTIAAIEGAHDQAMKVVQADGLRDPVHFQEWVYDAWGRILWTELGFGAE